MKLKLTVVAGDEIDDVSVSIDASATVGQLAERIRVGRPVAISSVEEGPSLSVRISPGTASERTAAPTATLSEAGIRSGDTIALTNAGGSGVARAEAAATVRVINGPDAGKLFSVPAGSSHIGRGRDCEIRLSDPLVSKRHARIVVTDMIEVVDDNSANGTIVNDEPVQRVAVRPGDAVTIGDTEMTISLQTVAGSSSMAAGSTVEFNRSPRLDPKYPGVELVAPEPPKPPEPRRFPWITIIAPLLMGAILYIVTKNILSILFIGLSPIMIVGAFFENRYSMAKSLVESSAQFRDGLRDLAVQLQYAAEIEQKARRREYPSIVEVVQGVHSLSPITWTRRPEHESFAEVRLGLGTRPSRNSVKTPEKNQTTPELWAELQAVVGQFAFIDRVPVVADLRSCGNVGVAGPSTHATPLASAAMAGLVGLHSPAELVVAAAVSASSVERWEWLKWLPHSGGDFSPMACEHLASSPRQVGQLVAELEQLLREREDTDDSGSSEDSTPLPIVLVLVQDDAVEDRARMVQLAELGPSVGVHLLWVAAVTERLPAACRTFLEVDPATGEGMTGYVRSGEGVVPVELEPLDGAGAMAFARALSPVVDAGALLEDQSDLPRAVSFLALSGLEIADDPAEVIEHWRGSNSIPEPDAPKLKRDNTLRALVGQSTSDRYYLDLRTQGPHALVGGTTGSGKSEFLQTWILGMAAAHSPARVNFLLIDYKGGTAFADCVDLPHTVGLVTDLSPHLVRRALTSLKAELRRREHVLNAHRAKDLLDMEKHRYAETPPSLVIVVDEFAALVGEVPEFVDGVVDVAQRGRSLGLHLVLATQRPSGVIKGSLRANTNLRVALRIADEEDSTDVVGSPIAATFDPGIPGRAVAKTGPGRLAGFQTAYLGGHTTSEPPAPSIDVFEMPFGLGQSWDEPEVEEPSIVDDAGPTDIGRMVKTIRKANEVVALPSPRKPWLPELAPTYRLEDLPSARTDTELVYGVIDHPEEQDQPVVSFKPDQDGNMVVYGTGGSGKSTFLRAIAVAAGLASARGGPCQVYALDFGARGLSMLDELPHMGAVIGGDDGERTLRLLKMLRSTIDERATRYSAVNASTIVEYRDRSGNGKEPRLLLLIDNFGAFRQEYETGRRGNPYELLEAVAADGRSVGVHVIVTADRSSALSAGLKSVVQSQMCLRLASENDFMTLGVPEDVFSESTPPGRGVVGDNEVQVGVLGGSPNMARQAAATRRLAEAMIRADVQPAPPIERLAEYVAQSSMPADVNGGPVLGVWDETLAPIGFEPSGTFIVSGPPQSGKTTAMLSLLRSLRRVADADTEYVLFGPRKSSLAAFGGFAQVLTSADDGAEYANVLTGRIRSGQVSSNLVVIIEALGEWVNSLADDPLQTLIRACRSEGYLVIVEGEVSDFAGNYGLLAAVKSDRCGIVLQPDEINGDHVLGTEFPRVKRADFPQGRGMYAKSGRVMRVQMPVPDVGSVVED